MEEILFTIMNTLLTAHIIISIYVYISIVDKKKAGFIGIILSAIPILNIYIYKTAKEANILNDIEIMKEYRNDKEVYNNLLSQLVKDEMTSKQINIQIQNDLKELGVSSIRDPKSLWHLKKL